MTRVLAVDPGGTTGWTWFDTVTRMHDSGVLKGHHEEHVQALVKWLMFGVPAGHEDFSAAVPWSAGVDVLVMEDFNLRVDLHRGAASRRETLSPVRIIACVEWELGRLVRLGELSDRSWGTTGGSGPRYWLQSSADAKSFATDERLRRWGMYVTPEHARDAMRHALLWASRHHEWMPADGAVVRGVPSHPTPATRPRRKRV